MKTIAEDSVICATFAITTTTDSISVLWSDMSPILHWS